MTGYIGFKHEGTLSYLHCILQFLFAIKDFRKAVYAVPTEGQEPTRHIALALQRLFYQMQHSDKPVCKLQEHQNDSWHTIVTYCGMNSCFGAYQGIWLEQSRSLCGA